MIKFKDFNFKENYRYLNLLKMCLQIPSVLSPQMLFCYKEQLKIKRGYVEELCWHKCEVDGSEFWIVPAGDWDEVNWQKVFTENVPEGTTFLYVPEYLTNLWKKQLGAAIEAKKDRDNWDYILYLDRIEKLRLGRLKDIRLGRNSFAANYEYAIEPLEPEIFDELREFQSTLNDTETYGRNFSYSLEHWANLQNLYGFVVRVGGKIIAYALDEQIDETHSIGQFLRASEEFEGAREFVRWYDAKMNLERGILTQNIMTDVGEENLRFFKEHLAPLVMLKKFVVTYNPTGKELVPQVETYEGYDLQISFERQPDALIISLMGKLNTEAAHWAQKNILSAADGVHKVTFDLAELDYISSSGLRILVAVMKKMQANGGSMTLKNVGEQVGDVLKMTGFDKIFNVEKFSAT